MSENSGEWDNKRRNYTRELIAKREALLESQMMTTHTLYDVTWSVALHALKNRLIVSRFCSTWKNSEMRLWNGEFQDRHYIEGILEHCEPHWTDWTVTERHTFPANLEAEDWIIREPGQVVFKRSIR